MGALHVTRPQQVASIVEDGQQDVVATAAQIGTGDLAANSGVMPRAFSIGLGMIVVSS
jgi:hypothetical protein